MILTEDVASMSRDRIEQSAAAINRSVVQIAGLVESFADMRKMEVDSLDLVILHADLSELLRDCISDMEQLTGNHDVRYCAPEHLMVDMDVQRVRRIILNLLANAAKFSPGGTTIIVTAAETEHEAIVSVRDQGPGIRADRTGELFKKFSRLDPSVKGTGIGLYLSRGIARAHGGDLALGSMEGPGSEFVLTLPKAFALASIA
jgi:signal transduction histidine kinase